jgi:prevent-host-death family protein
MSSISISQLKARPSKIIEKALDYPVAIQKRNRIKAYLIGKDLYEKLVSYIENYIDRKAVEETDFAKGKDFEKVAEELDI